MLVSHIIFLVARWRKTGPALALALLLIIVSMSMIACSGLSSSGGMTPTSTPSRVALSRLTWCGKPLVLFRDEGAAASPTTTATAIATTTGTPTGTTTVNSTPTATGTVTSTPTTSGPRTITDWSQVQPSLDFTVYLPATLPAHTCLVSVSGTIHDPIFGSNFIIGYLLPNHSSISLSEAPLRSQSQEFQCSPSSGVNGTPSTSGTPKSGTATSGVTPTPTAAPTQLCSGAKGNTNIFFSAPGTTAQLQQFFNTLQPNVDWMPASK
jgi:hypothetical protein